MTAVYSLSWAEDRVKELVGKYPRATDFVCKALGITTKQMSVYLACKDPLWPNLRRMVHLCDDDLKKQEKLTAIAFLAHCRDRRYFDAQPRLALRIDNQLELFHS